MCQQTYFVVANIVYLAVCERALVCVCLCVFWSLFHGKVFSDLFSNFTSVSMKKESWLICFNSIPTVVWVTLFCSCGAAGLSVIVAFHNHNHMLLCLFYQTQNNQFQILFVIIGPVELFFGVKLRLFTYSSVKSCILGA